jgi:CHAT domain-containing protein
VAPGASEIVSIAALQQRLKHTGAAVLELVLLPGELVAFCITAEDATVDRRPVANERVLALIAREDDAALYDLLIRPEDATFARARHLVVVADPALAEVSFAALYDSIGKRHLIERFPISLAPSASGLRFGTRGTKPRSILAVALPSGESSGSAGLPAGEAELRDIVSGYGEHASILNATFVTVIDAASRADIIHIGGHTERQPGLGDAALLFRDGAVSWHRIAEHPLTRAKVIVLAACETLRTPPSAQARALSLGGAFLAAGAENVIGTLAPVPDEQARAIFTSVHANISRGDGVAAALRGAQLEALALQRGTAWRDVAVLTTRIELEQERSDG